MINRYFHRSHHHSHQKKNSVNSITGSLSKYMESPELNKSPANKMTIINRDANIL